MTDVQNVDFRDKDIAEIPIGCPSIISVSGKVVCPSSKRCAGHKASILPNMDGIPVCINYDPMNIDYVRDNMRCANWRDNNAVPKKSSSKKVLQRRARR